MPPAQPWTKLQLCGSFRQSAFPVLRADCCGYQLLHEVLAGWCSLTPNIAQHMGSFSGLAAGRDLANHFLVTIIDAKAPVSASASPMRFLCACPGVLRVHSRCAARLCETEALGCSDLHSAAGHRGRKQVESVERCKGSCGSTFSAPDRPAWAASSSGAKSRS